MTGISWVFIAFGRRLWLAVCRACASVFPIAPCGCGSFPTDAILLDAGDGNIMPQSLSRCAVHASSAAHRSLRSSKVRSPEHRGGANVTAEPQVQAPGERFNFAEHLIQRKLPPLVQDGLCRRPRPMSFGELTAQIQRAAAALLASGMRREERVLLLMHDCNDWPVRIPRRHVRRHRAGSRQYAADRR